MQLPETYHAPAGSGAAPEGAARSPSRRSDLRRAATVGLTVGAGVGIGVAVVGGAGRWSLGRPAGLTVPLLVIAGLASIAALVQLRRDREVDGLLRRVEALELERTELQRLSRGLERFAGAVAHDLRSPISVMVTTLELLSQRARGLSDAERHLVDTAARRGRRCVDLTHVLLAQTKQLAAHVERTPVSLGAIIDDALDQLASEVAAVRPELRIAPLPMVMGNRTLLVQVFQNLFSNALRYRHPDRPCRIHISAEQRDGMVRVEVADDGQGVPEDQREAMFRFGSTSGGDGSGIGLATAAALVAAHGGTIGAEDGSLAGIAIVLTLPVATGPTSTIDLGAGSLHV